MRIGHTTAIVFVSKLLGSALGFVSTLYFARVLGAEILGYFAVAMALVSWLKVGGSMGISAAMTKRISERMDQGAFLTSGLLLILITSLVFALIIVLFENRIDSYVESDTSFYILLIFLSGVLLTVVSSVLKGENRVHIAGVLTPLNVGISSLAQFILVFLGMELTGLFIGYLIGEIAIVLLGATLISIGATVPKRRHFRSLIDYARYAWMSGLKSQSFNDVDTLVLGALVNPSLVGIYSVAWSISQFLSLFGRSIRSALFPEISQAEAEQNDEQIARLTNNSLTYIGLIAMPGFFGSLVLGDRLMRIYGPEFEQGSIILSLLVLAVLIYSYQQQLTGILNGIDRPDVTFRVNVAFIVTNLVLNVVLVMWRGWIGAAIASVISTIVGTVIAFWMLRRLVDFDVPVREIGQQFGSAIFMAVAIESLRRFLEGVDVGIGNFGTVLLLVSVGAGLYFSTLLAISPNFRKTVWDNLPDEVPL